MARIADPMCPRTGMSIAVAHRRVFSISGDGTLVRFSSINNPAEWTPPTLPEDTSTAGFIDVGQHSGGAIPTALVVYRGFLVVFFPETIQTWRIAADPRRLQASRDTRDRL